MSFEPANTVSAFIPPNTIIPNEWREAQLVLTDYFLKQADAINVREIAQYDEATTVTGQQWFTDGDATKFRYGFRKVIDIGGLPDFGATDPKNVAHGITTTENFCITHLYGAATDPAASTLNSAIPLPYVDAGGTAHVGLSMDETNIIISGDGATDYSAYTCAYVVVEWVETS